MSVGYQAVQSAHAVADLLVQYPEETRQWHKDSNTIVLLSVPTEKDLFNTAKALRASKIVHIEFREPDIGNALTSLALLPNEAATQFCKGNFSVALHPYRIDANKNSAASDKEKRTRELVKKMSSCFQTKEQTIFDHGMSVRDYTFDLLGILEGNKPKFNWQLPSWFFEYKDLILKNLLDEYYIEKYTVFHDCGKPFCLTTDEDGKQHFLHHAETSYQTWMTLEGNEQIGRLIRMDMDIHTLKPEQVAEFAARKEATTLLIVGLAELHSNATLFGGINSVGFKSKWKKLNRRGKEICDLIQRTDKALSIL